ncbi:DUF3105 domain-containing protein [Nocardioides sp. W7]|uniref:DUF3105 domain-containing protein n=1 Tax=Nocardioides sp. W7 TaxID=2931390 RepID=UPI001FD4AD4C|nr:DUF3105 domain-containing protein [Nocardioides sp. W7]
MTEHEPPPLPTYQPYPTVPPPVSPPVSLPDGGGEVLFRSLGETPPPRRTGRVVVALVVGAALVAGAIAVPVSLLADEPPPDLSEVVVVEDLRTDHLDDDISYPTTPPIGGPHADVWLDCGAYDVPVRNENAVHDLEHGSVWITYRSGLSDDDVEVLADLLPQNGILSPYDDLPAPVVVTVWGRQLRLDGADDERLPLFIDEYAGGVTAPEPGVTCAGGIPDPTGGTGSVV